MYQGFHLSYAVKVCWSCDFLPLTMCTRAQLLLNLPVTEPSFGRGFLSLSLASVEACFSCVSVLVFSGEMR
ncbi:hypothetical protein DPMN_093475 [Dreissena polymorpha]|uniref:Uncharacterized protein n=1 Tax=Dreissena polymorpha TaxID=45954 RepID=A0A9D4L485_DREPO|nr:hypothetical protein DPMN_093475 [Dreissena polymorpha]